MEVSLRFDLNMGVVIGIDRYENPSVFSFTIAVSDASAIADLLERKNNYK
ncbi:hypothetical protein [Altericista sp. CCNU0014]